MVSARAQGFLIGTRAFPVTQIIDRRLNGKNKSVVNRQRFIRRFKSQIRKAAGEAISGRSITDASSGERINIPARDISEPVFRHGAGGRQSRVYPGNTDFVTGDVPGVSDGFGNGPKISNLPRIDIQKGPIYETNRLLSQALEHLEGIDVKTTRPSRQHLDRSPIDFRCRGYFYRVWRRAVSEQNILSRKGEFRSLQRCKIPSVISTLHPR